MISCFPIPFPDELFYSVLCRAHDRLGKPNRSAFAEMLFGGAGRFPGILCAKHTDALVNRMSDRHPLRGIDFDGKHSLLPLFESFCFGKRFSPTEPHHLSSCPACREEDIKAFGCAFWHRSHQVPYGKFCHKHALQLQTSIQPCVSSRETGRNLVVHFLMPEEVEWIDHPHPSRVEVFLRFHARVQEILNGQSLSGNDRVQTVFGACQSQGYINGLHIESDKILRDGRSIVGDLLESLFLIPSGDYAKSVVSSIVRGREANPNRNLFVYEVLGLGVGERVKANPISRKESRRRGMRVVNREKCGQFRAILRTMPDADTSQIQSADPLLFQWLVENDPDWLNSTLSLRSRRRRLRDGRLAIEDPLSARCVRKGESLLKSLAGRPRRISRSAILKMLSAEERRMAIRCWRQPLTQKAFKEAEETYEEFIFRRIDWAILQLPAGGRPSLWDFSALAGISNGFCRLPELKYAVQRRLDDWESSYQFAFPFWVSEIV
ncbi:TniQ family protein [Pelagicoccus sp. SDUM812005]|uniref:TniQ family protein n=1 Tax=Pelagicoccus sp. SDUM812005 TaxID=3041257 RepID=UPI00280C7368|nr:TniQ family protein [Pelagicoccus sp. SDUM812005]MDQ8181883.1 TniQ family protein [Pelagicoccus sp. SDUM812005]